ncbi:MAG: anthranilate synthase component I family protein [Parvularculaceae bacterium]
MIAQDLVIREIDWRSPAAAFAPFAHEPHAALLDAGASASGARWSFVCARPSERLEARDGATFLNGEKLEISPFEALARLQTRRSRAPDGVVPPLVSGLVGFAGYECGAIAEPSARGPASAGDAPDFAFAAFDTIAAFDSVEQRAFITTLDEGGAAEIEAVLGTAEPAAVLPALVAAGSNFSPARYREAVRQVIDCILAGAIYQANISQRLMFECGAPIDAFSIFTHAVARSSAAHAAYLNPGKAQIVSLSPERFFSVSPVDGAMIIRAEPIKGTRPRGANAEEDSRLLHDLVTSAKDRAENIMIADLTRNDLSRLCVDGSIREEAICEAQSHATVHHLVSRISGRLRPDLSAADALQALFPCGSITGAPKVEAMKTIAAVEGIARGPYCGAIGYLDDRGGADFSVAIRTAIVEGQRVTLPVGGGITLRSEPREEYQETLDKAEWFLRLIGASSAATS